jgi:hypothetical protein
MCLFILYDERVRDWISERINDLRVIFQLWAYP